MGTASVSQWRFDVRGRIDGLQLHYDGIGAHQYRHATAYQTSRNGKRLWLVDVLEDTVHGDGDVYTYGQCLPLTRKMAVEIATRFVTGKTIPKRLEWR